MKERKTMRVNFDIEIPEEVRQIFIKDGIKEEDADRFVRDLLQKVLNQLLASFPETLLAMKTGAISTQEVISKWYITGSNLGAEERQEYKKNENAVNRA